MDVGGNMDINTGLSPSSPEEFLDLGVRYSLGRGVGQSNVLAHMWFNIAALKGNESAKQYRHELAQEMSTAEISEAQRQARNWLTIH
jgi:TPR repeat protein